MRVVLDTSALIYLNDFRDFDEMFTVEDVVNEVKDNITSMKVSSLDLKIIEPDEESVNEIKSVAKETGDLEKLSQTDLKVLSLAKEKDCMIISDDRNVQNVAEKIGLRYVGFFNKQISKLVVWKKYCKNCGKFFDEGDVCEICGSELVRKPKERSYVK